MQAKSDLNCLRRVLQMAFTPFPFLPFLVTTEFAVNIMACMMQATRRGQSNKPQRQDGTITCQYEDVISLAYPQAVASKSVVKQTCSYIRMSTECLDSLSSVYVRYALDVAPVPKI